MCVGFNLELTLLLNVMPVNRTSIVVMVSTREKKI